MDWTVRFEPAGVSVRVEAGTTLLRAQIAAGLRPDAPCGGRGTCGKCRAMAGGREVLTCQTAVDRDMTVTLPQERRESILTTGSSLPVAPDRTDQYVLAVDVGTTTLAAYLLDGYSGAPLSTGSALNPQVQYGADVISRIQYALEGGGEALRTCVEEALAALTERLAAQAGISPREITAAAAAGNTAMHHLLLGIPPASLVTPPYMPAVSQALEREGLLPISGGVRLLPNIAGFVGGDTVACMAAVRFDTLEELTLLIDIGTNGEMVLGDKNGRIACSTAAGPAFEGAGISCGMRGAAGAVDRVWLEGGTVRWHVIGGGEAAGLCGSGLLDLTAVLLELGAIDGSGLLEGGAFRLGNTPVVLTQKDVREVQLAKAAIRAGAELLAWKLGRAVEDIRTVYLAGAFGSSLNPASACSIGMLPPCLEDRVVPIGNAAGEGAKLCALSREAYAYSQALAGGTAFLELASLPQFQGRYVDALLFSEDEE